MNNGIRSALMFCIRRVLTALPPEMFMQLAFAWLAILDVTLAMYDPFAVVVSKQHRYHQGGGKAKAYATSKKGKKHGSHKGHKKKSKSSDSASADSNNGYGYHKLDDYDGGGKKSRYFTDDFFQDYGHKQGGSSRGGFKKYGGKKKNRKFTRGFREKYHKDEETKSSSFYSNRNKGGDYDIFGEEFSKGGNEKGNKYSGGTKHSKHEEDHWGKQGNKAKGHDASESSGYNKHKGKEHDYSTGKTYKKKDGSSLSDKVKGKNNHKHKSH